jgi:two-component sensor histidine kinase
MWDETTRLAALHRYGILDTPVEAAFDDFVEIASQVCEAPIAVVNLIDEARQWFAAEKGLGVREMPLDASICAHAILQPGIFVIPDLTKDPQFDCNPLVTGEPRLRFYGGALLETAEGLPIGTMCVLDYKPRPGGLTKQQEFTLKALARQVMTQLELRRSVAELGETVATKNLLVQEVHHRVKNSLSMVQALLMLQARATSHEEAAQQLKESAGRVRSIGSMHEHLYRMSAASHVDVSSYLRGLVKDQQKAFASEIDGRSVSFTGKPAIWPSSEAPALGLILTELVTNAMKYGAGAVRVSLTHMDGEAVLTVEDEGEGLADDFEPSESKGLGMRIITGLLRGHGGRLEVDRSRGGTCFIATVNVPPMPSAVPRPT